MKTSELGPMWLKDRAKHLRAAATNADGAYQSGALRVMCQRVARAYRRAAAVLDVEAEAMAREASKAARPDPRDAINPDQSDYWDEPGPG